MHTLFAIGQCLVSEDEIYRWLSSIHHRMSAR